MCQNALCVSSKTGKEIIYIPILAVEPSATHTKGAAGKGAITELGKYWFLNTVFSWLFNFSCCLSDDHYTSGNDRLCFGYYSLNFGSLRKFSLSCTVGRFIRSDYITNFITLQPENWQIHQECGQNHHRGNYEAKWVRTDDQLYLLCNTSKGPDL